MYIKYDEQEDGYHFGNNRPISDPSVLRAILDPSRADMDILDGALFAKLQERALPALIMAIL